MAGDAPQPAGLSTDDLLAAVNAAAAFHKSSPNEISRLQFRGVVMALGAALESPPEAMFRTLFEPHRLTCVRIGDQAGWLDALLNAPNGTLTATELAEQSGSDKALVKRIFRVLTAEGYATEVDLETYAPSRLTWAFTAPGLRHGIMHSSEALAPVVAKFPQYLVNTGFKEPQNEEFGPYTYAHGVKFWDHLAREPRRRDIFNTFMTAQKSGRGEAGGWLDVFPLQERLEKPQNAGKAALVGAETLVAGPVDKSTDEELGKGTTEVAQPAVELEKVTNLPANLKHEKKDSGIDIPLTAVEKPHPSEPNEMRKPDAEPDVVEQASALPSQPQDPPSLDGDPEVPVPVTKISADDEVLLVDIGGGNGHELRNFRKRFPSSSYPGRVILQDLPATISALDQAAFDAVGISIQSHDFFTPEPVFGAQFYYLASIIHDWPDTDAIRILKQVSAAMKINHSSVVIVDLVVPEKAAPSWTAFLDITLMTLMCGKERTTAELAELVGQAGLRIRKDGVHMLGVSGGLGEGATECVLIEDERP